MSIRIGDVDVATQILDNEFRIAVLERIVEKLLASVTGPITGGPISVAELSKIRSEVFEELKKKYPNSGLTYNENSK